MMNYIKNYNQFKLNELYTHTKDKEDINDKYFILYKKDLWIFDNKEWDEQEIWKEINKILGDDILNDDIYDSLSELELNHPYILSGSIEDDYIILKGVYNFRHSKTSTDLQKLKKELGLPIKVLYGKGSYMDDQGEFIIRDMGEYEDVYFYHGTSTRYLEQISKTGIRPMPMNTNFDKVVHEDKIFITTNLEKALFHANTTSLKTQSFPIILKLRVPDINKLVIDYDLAIELYGVDSELNQSLGYSDIRNRVGGYKMDGSLIKGTESMDLVKKMGVFGYLGRIPATYIDEVLLDTPVMINHPYLLSEEISELFGQETGYTEEYWDDFSDVDDWSSMRLKSAIDYIDNIIDDNLSQFDDDDDY